MTDRVLGQSEAIDDDDELETEFASSGPGPRVVAISVAVVAVLVFAGIVVWQLLPRSPSDTSAEAGFARDMSVHHAQAVEMALIIRDRTADETLRIVATDIILTQQNQIGQMQGWLSLWDLRPTGPEPAMAWMGHPVDGLMPGMATAEDVTMLRDMPLDDAEVSFMQLMIAHHTGGIDMAEAVVERSDQDDVVRLANAIITGQQLEIDLFTGMLEERGEPVEAPPMQH